MSFQDGELMSFTLNENIRQQSRMFEALDYLSHTEAGIGIPAEKDHHSGPFTASELLYLHERGCPANHLPPRPVMEPALSDAKVQADMAEALLGALDSALEGDPAGAEAGLEKTGQIGTDALRNYILDGSHLAPNAPVTIHGGWMRSHVSGKPVHIPGKSGDTPLLDTGELVNSFGCKIRSK